MKLKTETTVKPYTPIMTFELMQYSEFMDVEGVKVHMIWPECNLRMACEFLNN